MSRNRPTVMMLGLRGVPEIQGGVEAHVEQLARLFVKQGWSVDVLGRKSHVAQREPYVWNGVNVIPLWAAHRTSLEAVSHTILGVLFAALRRPDVLHIHAIGPSLLTPLARGLGLNVVVTHHGFDYDREKWGPIARRALRMGEWAGMRFASARIAVSRHIADAMTKRYGVPVQFIPNGVSVGTNENDFGALERFGLKANQYVVVVARIVPEKRQHDLIAAFAAMQRSGHHRHFKLVIIGAAHHESTYADKVKRMVSQTDNVVWTGIQRGDALATLFRNASLFVLPSSHEGMPIALLEAIGYGLPVLASNITANLEVGLPAEDYFPVGEIEALARRMTEKLDHPYTTEVASRKAAEVASRYSWEAIAEQTLAIYRRLLV